MGISSYFTNEEGSPIESGAFGGSLCFSVAVAQALAAIPRRIVPLPLAVFARFSRRPSVLLVSLPIFEIV